VTDSLRIYRDDGPLSDLAAAVLPRLRLSSVAVAFIGLVVLLAGLAVDGADTSLPTALGVAAFVVSGLASGVAQPHERIQWLLPPMLRGAEYLLIITLAWRADPQSLPLAYGLLAVLAFHHYDIVYRLRHQRVPPPDWIRRLGGGWELRVLIVAAAAVSGVPFQLMILAVAAWCALLFVGESMMSWSAVARDERRTVEAGIDEPEEEGVD
jgi:hypothetical protein